MYKENMYDNFLSPCPNLYMYRKYNLICVYTDERAYIFITKKAEKRKEYRFRERVSGRWRNERVTM